MTLVLLVVLLLTLAGCESGQKQESTAAAEKLFSLTPEEVSAVEIRNGTTGESREPQGEERQEILEKILSFTYVKKEEAPDPSATGWTLAVDITPKQGDVIYLEFGANYIKWDNMLYYCDGGIYFSEAWLDGLLEGTYGQEPESAAAEKLFSLTPDEVSAVRIRNGSNGGSREPQGEERQEILEKILSFTYVKKEEDPNTYEGWTLIVDITPKQGDVISLEFGANYIKWNHTLYYCEEDTYFSEAWLEGLLEGT